MFPFVFYFSPRKQLCLQNGTHSLIDFSFSMMTGSWGFLAIGALETGSMEID
jgi:hypothetical protein